jgi:endonuclease YncB( thermonuclease family)
VGHLGNTIVDADMVLAAVKFGGSERIPIANISSPAKGQDGWESAVKFTTERILRKSVTFLIPKNNAGDSFLEYDDAPGVAVGVPTGGAGHLDQELLKAGLAWHYKAYSADPELDRLEAEARRAKRGLRSKPNPVPPWEFRAGKR